MNIEEEITQIKKDITSIQTATLYNTKMLEELTSLIGPQENSKKSSINIAMAGLKTMLENDPNMKKAGIDDTLKNIFKVFEGVGT